MLFGILLSKEEGANFFYRRILNKIERGKKYVLETLACVASADYVIVNDESSEALRKNALLLLERLPC